MLDYTVTCDETLLQHGGHRLLSSEHAMSAPQKLTKKQKKGVAFRERKQGKRTKVPQEDAGDDLDVPVAEDQDLAGIQVGNVEAAEAVGNGKNRSARKDEDKGKNKEGAKSEAADVVVESSEGKKKRKREVVTEDKGNEEDKPKRKRKKGAVSDGEGSGNAPADGKKTVSSEGKQRFILFVGV